MSSDIHKKLGSWVAEKLATKDQRISDNEDEVVVLNDYSLAFGAAKQVLELTETSPADMESIDLAIEVLEDEFEELDRRKRLEEKKAKLSKLTSSK